MKSPEEIKKALRCHASDHSYDGCYICPYYDGEECEGGLVLDALACIEQLEEQIDLMKLQMRGDCGTCAHKLTGAAVCAQCLQGDNRPNWAYEGLPEVNAP